MDRGQPGLGVTLAHEQGIDVDIDRAALDLDTKLALVAASLGVALMPDLMATSTRPDIAVVAPAAAPTRGIHAVTRPGRTDLTETPAPYLSPTRDFSHARGSKHSPVVRVLSLTPEPQGTDHRRARLSEHGGRLLRSSDLLVS